MSNTTTKPLAREDIERIVEVIRTEESPGLIYTQITELERQIDGTLITGNSAFKLLLRHDRRARAAELWQQIAEAWNLGVESPPTYHVSVQFTGSPADFIDQSSAQTVRTKVLDLVRAWFPGARGLTVNVTRESEKD